MITVRQAREATRTIELWMQQNIDADDKSFKIARLARLAMHFAAVPDNNHEPTQQEHRMRLRLFAEVTDKWPIVE